MKGEENFVEFRVKILFFSRDEIFFYGTRDRQVDTFLTNKSDTKSGLDWGIEGRMQSFRGITKKRLEGSISRGMGMKFSTRADSCI